METSTEATGRHGVFGRQPVFRILGTLTVVLGAAYLAWRCSSSVNDRALWFAIPLLAAEIYGFVGTVLFVLTMWKPTHRVAPSPLDAGTVDVFITTYNEPVDLVRLTVDAALRIDWPQLKVWVLDDGARAGMQVMARELGAEYLTRGEEWTGKPRHAKAGNINNALTQTDGEYILVLDADQIPDSRIVRRIIGYFRDPELAFVQTPQRFYNLPPGDPFGADAPLFYGPILQGKDGWDAAFYCGSNALLRREALLELGVTEYVRDMEAHFARALRTLRRDLSGRSTRNVPAARLLRDSLRSASDALRTGASLERVSDMVREAVAAARASCDHPDVLAMTCDLEQLVSTSGARGRSHRSAAHGGRTALQEALGEVSLTRPDEALPVLPLATISVTEDMATAMRLHALGWKSVFHTEVLAWGLAPEDLRSALAQRRRWAQGTIQVFLRENPLFVRGLSLPQRLQYLATMLSYFDGFASLVFLLSPVVTLLTGLAPVRTSWVVFLSWLLPYLAVNRLMYLYVAHGIQIRRSEQFSLALFPIWIEVVLRTPLQRHVKFVVTPKSRQVGSHLGLVWPQLAMIALTSVAIAYGVLAFAFGGQGTLAGVATSVFWGGYGIAMLLPIVRAAVFRPPEGWSPRPPAFLLAPGETTR